MPLLPWLLAALALGAGGGFLFWRSRSREAALLGPEFSEFSSPEPTPAPPPQPRKSPAPAAAEPLAVPGTVITRRAQEPSIPGLVSTRLRPWIDFRFEPLRCVLEDQKVTFEFQLELYNSGSAAARAVLLEARLFNAGPTQEAEMAHFFANPVGQGERIVSLAPLKRLGVRTKVELRRDQVQEYEIGGRKVFVPLIAFNSLYRWSGGEGQSSASFLLGVDTKSAKLAPFRLDHGPRLFNQLSARELPQAVRS